MSKTTLEDEKTQLQSTVGMGFQTNNSTFISAGSRSLNSSKGFVIESAELDVYKQDLLKLKFQPTIPNIPLLLFLRISHSEEFGIIQEPSDEL